MQKLFESYLAGLIKYETRSNPNPLLEATELPDVFLIREKVGDAPTIIRVTVSPVLTPVVEPAVSPTFTTVDNTPVVVTTTTTTEVAQPDLVTTTVVAEEQDDADGEDDVTADGVAPSTTGHVSKRRRR